jgi:ribosome-associated protein
MIDFKYYTITMKNDVAVKNGIIIPEHELEITTSRSGGAGGQHVNKTSTKITVRWNVKTTSALNDEQKNRVLEKLASQLTAEGDLIIHSSATRSQEQNRKMALVRLAQIVSKALYVQKKRMKTKVSESTKHARLEEKSHRGHIKKLRSKKIFED